MMDDFPMDDKKTRGSDDDNKNVLSENHSKVIDQKHVFDLESAMPH